MIYFVLMRVAIVLVELLVIISFAFATGKAFESELKFLPDFEEEIRLFEEDLPYLGPQGNWLSRDYEHVKEVPSSDEMALTSETTLTSTAKINLFSIPISVKVDDEGNAVVADSVRNSIYVLDREGKCIRTIHPVDSNGKVLRFSPSGLALYGMDRFFISDSLSHQIIEMDNSGRVLARYGEIGDSAGKFYEPAGLVIAPDRSIFAVDRFNNRINIYSKFRMPRIFEIHSIDTEIRTPSDIAINPAGRVLISDTGNDRIVCTDLEGSFLFFIGGERGTGPGKFHSPAGLALDGMANIYVADTFNSRVQKFDREGRYIGSIEGKLRFPVSVAVDLEGNVIVADMGTHSLHYFNGHSFAKGRRLYSERNYGEAIKYLRKAISMERENSFARYYLAVCLERTEQKKEAFKLYCEIVKRDRESRVWPYADYASRRLSAYLGISKEELLAEESGLVEKDD